MNLKMVSRSRTNLVLVINIKWANSFCTRLFGLVRKPELKFDEGLLLSPCNSIHTFGMKFPIDVVFISATGIVTRCVCHLPPRRVAMDRRANHVLELRAGSIQCLALNYGDQLDFLAIYGDLVDV